MKIKKLAWEYDLINDLHAAKFPHKYFRYVIQPSHYISEKSRAEFKTRNMIHHEWDGEFEELKRICQAHYESIIREGLEDD